MEPNQDLIKRWNSSASYWERHREVIRQMFTPVTKALIEDAQIEGGHAVLDIATGPGEPALSIAALVGPEGKVAGADPSPEMVEAARREAARLGIPNAQFEVAFADHLPFPPDTFDAVVSRFGVMFFPSPADGIREMLRVLKPGRRLALAAWGFADRNPFFHILQRALDRFVEVPSPVPDALDAFRFASPGKLQQVLADAGAVPPSERVLEFRIEAPVSAEDFFTIRCEMSEKLRDTIGALSGDQVKEVREETIQGLREYSTERGISLPAEVVIVSGASASTD